MSLDESFKKLVKEALREVLEEKGQAQDEKWVTPAEAAEIIGGHSREEIVALVKKGFISGHQRQPETAKSHWRIWLPSLKAYSRALAEKKKK